MNFHTIESAAKRVDKSEQTIRNWMNAPEPLPVTAVGDRVLIREDDLLEHDKRMRGRVGRPRKSNEPSIADAIGGAMPFGAAMGEFSAWIDATYPDGMDEELVLRRRIDKVSAEFGEVMEALEGYTGENPRKGVFDSIDHVMQELLDVALSALGAWEHADGNRGRSAAMLLARLLFVRERVGLEAVPA